MLKARFDMVQTAHNTERRKFSTTFGVPLASVTPESQGGPRKRITKGKLMDQLMQTRNRQSYTRAGCETVNRAVTHDSMTNSDFYSTQFGGGAIGAGNGISAGKDSITAGGSVTRRFPTIEEIRNTGLMPRRRITMKMNNTGRSIKGGGGQGSSRSPCSQSGMDPNLRRGRSSQINFDIKASEK